MILKDVNIEGVFNIRGLKNNPIAINGPIDYRSMVMK